MVHDKARQNDKLEKSKCTKTHKGNLSHTKKKKTWTGHFMEIIFAWLGIERCSIFEITSTTIWKMVQTSSILANFVSLINGNDYIDFEPSLLVMLFFFAFVLCWWTYLSIGWRGQDASLNYIILWLM